jgi:UDP-galactopyranose mutase
MDSKTLSDHALVCFSHLRWNFVYQRPQHLISRAARQMKAIFFEEPVFLEGIAPQLDLRRSPEGVYVAVPQLPTGMPRASCVAAQRALLDEVTASLAMERVIGWYYTPMSLTFSSHLRPGVTVYDCMDELALFKDAPPELAEYEAELFRRADVVFTGGQSLYQAKRRQHRNVHAFASSVDLAHFAAARSALEEPADLRDMAHPRLAFVGVIDERMDLELVGTLAKARPDWSVAMIGPVAKVDPGSLPQAPNLHWLGSKSYSELPSYLRHVDVALMPFALNEATRFISPTKTPEYLAAGKPVVSTPVADVVRPYGDAGLVHIARDAQGFVAATELALRLADSEQRQAQADRFLAGMSWDKVWSGMRGEIGRAAGWTQASFRVAASGTADSPPKRLASRSHRSDRRFNYLVVGAGFAGSVMAERLATIAGKRVLLVDRRSHIGGNAYDCYDEAGILIHRYGPHIFHTNSPEVFAYLSQFTAWRPYEHRVRAQVDGKLVPIPINLTTINQLYGLSLGPADMDGFLAARAEAVADIRNSEDVVVARVGRELYEKFFRGYTRKQWGLDPSVLDKSVTARIPTRADIDDRYFSDRFQAMPLHGYTRMFERMLDHPNISIMLNTDYRDVQGHVDCDEIVYTGPIDEFFDCRFGELPYRSLRFKHETLTKELHQPVAVVNYPDEHVPYTRITEYKQLTGQSHRLTSISYEFPSAHGDPYYPIPMPENAELYRRYQKLADAARGVHFVGRLATYRYYNMDQVVAQGLAAFANIGGVKRARRIAATAGMGAAAQG